MSAPATTTGPQVRGQRKTRTGVVISNRMTKTVVVRMKHLVRHPTYQRVVRRLSTVKAHDERNSASIGDWVKIMETRPISKDKRWRLVEILKRASEAPPVPGAEGEQGGSPGRSKSLAPAKNAS